MVKNGIQEVPEPPAVAALEEDPYCFSGFGKFAKCRCYLFFVSMLLVTTFYFGIFWWFDL